MLIRDARTQEAVAPDDRETAPVAATRDMFKTQTGPEPDSVRDGRAVFANGASGGPRIISATVTGDTEPFCIRHVTLPGSGCTKVSSSVVSECTPYGIRNSSGGSSIVEARGAPGGLDFCGGYQAVRLSPSR